VTDLHVLIIGAGLGGLCLAQGLRRAGVSVAVYERDDSPSSRNQGYRLTLNPEGSSALHACLPANMFELFAATCCMPPPRLHIYRCDLTGQQVTDSYPDTVADNPLQRPVSVDRLTLRQILLAGLGGVVRFGSDATGYQVGPNDTITVCFADGSHATGDVLVGADGAGSAVRREYLPHLRVVDTTLWAIYGKIPLTGPNGVAVSDYLSALFTAVVGPNRQTSLNLAPMRHRCRPSDTAAQLCPGLELPDYGDYLMATLCTRREHLSASDDALAAMDAAQLRRTAHALTLGWHPRVRGLLDLWDPTSLFLLPIRTSMPPARRWPTTNVTLLGDAIHAMSPGPRRRRQHHPSGRQPARPPPQQRRPRPRSPTTGAAPVRDNDDRLCLRCRSRFGRAGSTVRTGPTAGPR
jgi:2-polyprenyl-6-methoxyphenol hydroxylase-like FAD-dependent oxidoreductase